ncbi:MAG: PLP-dependent aminotransferase family protein, partial [Parvibaculaceae bacterium]|nr:PLP-dependent aminotransferase family protein [Parvibaculaceae bacterium]
MTNWIPKRETLERPLHISIASSMKEAISDGRLAVEERLPPHRTLADMLGVSVHTVSKAYDELIRQGLVGSHVGRGTFVLNTTQSAKQPFLMERTDQGLIDLSIARPLYDHFHVDKMQTALTELPNDLDPDAYLACRPNIGLESHRRSGAHWLTQCGLEVNENSVVMTNGVSHGMSIALASIARHGDVVVTDKIAHHLIISLCSYLGLRLQGLEMDEEGVLPKSFERACKHQDVKVFFTIPTLANPTASLMSEERREQLVAIARQYDVLIIEDDVLGPMPEKRPRPISAFAPERSIYLTSFTKCVIPGLRTGYLVAPDFLLPAITGRLIAFSWMATPLVSELASRWIEDGTANELVLWQREKIADRHAIAQEELAGLNWSGDPAALHLWLSLPDEWNARSMVEHAKALGVAIAPPEPFM